MAELQNMLAQKTTNEIARALSSDGTAFSIKPGLAGCEVYKILHRRGEAVVKIGTSEAGRKEINGNLKAYSEMKRIGISSILAPKIFEVRQTNAVSYIVLEYLGENFRVAANKDNIQEMTKTLIKNLKLAYEAALRKDPESSKSWLKERRDDLIRYFTQYIIPDGFGSNLDLELIRNIQVEKLAPQYTTWATRDLTPDNIFVNGPRLTVIDGRDKSNGIPIIDLAMFSTLTAEVYNLPNGAKSAQMAREFSKQIGVLMKADYGQEIYQLGEIYQYALSVRFRKNTDARSPLFVQRIRENLASISNALRK